MNNTECQTNCLHSLLLIVCSLWRVVIFNKESLKFVWENQWNALIIKLELSATPTKRYTIVKWCSFVAPTAALFVWQKRFISWIYPNNDSLFKQIFIRKIYTIKMYLISRKLIFALLRWKGSKYQWINNKHTYLTFDKNKTKKKILPKFK